MAQSQKKSGGSKKIGRNKLACAAYRNAARRERNKRRRVARDELRHNAQRNADRAANKRFKEYLRWSDERALDNELCVVPPSCAWSA